MSRATPSDKTNADRIEAMAADPISRIHEETMHASSNVARIVNANNNFLISLQKVDWNPLISSLREMSASLRKKITITSEI